MHDSRTRTIRSFVQRAGRITRAQERALADAEFEDVRECVGGAVHHHRAGAAARLHGRRPRVLPAPLALGRALAFALEKLLPDPPVTRAMLGVLHHDDAVDPGEACRRLGIELTPLDELLRRCVGPEAPAS